MYEEKRTPVLQFAEIGDVHVLVESGSDTEDN